MEYNNTIEMRTIEDKVYVCQNCWKSVSISGKLLLQISSSVCIENLGSIRWDWNMTDDISCPACGSKMFQCDKELVDVIVELNNMGFPTNGCCYGHDHDFGYVYFKSIPLKSKLLLRSACDLAKYEYEDFRNVILKISVPVGVPPDSEFSAFEDDQCCIILRAHKGVPKGMDASTIRKINDKFVEFLDRVIVDLKMRSVQ